MAKVGGITGMNQKPEPSADSATNESPEAQTTNSRTNLQQQIAETKRQFTRKS